MSNQIPDEVNDQPEETLKKPVNNLPDRVNLLPALLSGWLVGALMLAVMIAVYNQVVVNTISQGLLVTAFLCGLVTALVFRPIKSNWFIVLLIEMCAAVSSGIGLVLMANAFTLVVRVPILTSGTGAIISNLFLLCATPVYLGTRILILVWNTWTRLRKERIAFALTHAHLTVVLAAASFLFLVGTFFILSPDIQGITAENYTIAAPIFLQFITRVFPYIVTAVAMTGFGLAVALPFLALFSYTISRRLTRRLDALTRATNDIGNGNLSTRVQVEGEDELSNLQKNFNQMAGELERLAQDLQSERDKVAALLRNQQELTATVSHELRTPVATLRGYLDVDLAQWNQMRREDLHRDLERMQHEIKQLENLIEDLFTLSRAEVRQLSLNNGPVGVGSLVNNLVEVLAPLAWQRCRVEMVAKVEEDLPDVTADANRLEQVLQNLLQNGIQHTPPGGIVAVFVQKDEDFVRVDVTDTGDGISAEDMEHVWERYFKGQNHEGVSNAGIGLALVKELIELMGGRVSVTSQPHEGSRFSVFLRAHPNS